MDEVLDRMLRSEGLACEHARWRLESTLLPNGVLKDGSDMLVRQIMEGLSSATPDGALEAWELLNGAAGGAVEPTAADHEVVLRVRNALMSHAHVPIARLVDREHRPYDFLALEVVDAMLDYASPDERQELLAALDAFGLRGPSERQAVDVVLAGMGDDHPGR